MRSAGPRSLRANVSLALLGDLAAKGSGLLVLIAAARWLELKQMAVLGVALATQAIAVTVLDGGISLVLMRDGAASPSERRGLLFASLRLRAPLALAALSAGPAFGLALHETLLGIVVSGYAVVSAFNLSVLALFRAAQDLSVEAAWKIAIGAAGLAGALAALSIRPVAVAALVGLALPQITTAPILWRRAQQVLEPHRPQRALGVARTAAPFALLTAATLVYARSGTILLGALSDAQQTAAYTLASTLALGFLLVPNAITTGLLPRLSSEPSASNRHRLTRRALLFAGGQALVVLATGSVAAPFLLPLVAGERYRAAVVPLCLLLGANLSTAIASMLGTLAMAIGRARLIVWQIGVCLGVNLALTASLARPLGADAAAIGMLAAETIACGILARGLAGAPGARARRPALEQPSF